MDPDVEFAYTEGMSEDEVAAHLRETPHGVLSLADGGDAYAIPVFHHYEDGALYFRLGETPDSRKAAYIETTETATYVVYEAAATDDPEEQQGWSVLARGPVREVPSDDPAYDAVSINERFSPIRIFDEALDDVELTLYELSIEELAGRTN
ncbi:pyridoxamine 5'-phosphate oxidase family protein [Haloarcula nitratireducens]|uniref:Pyridoxamine 5'-phosphate oxidase family protein n=1 Tax=Haloarcula nitratireducens TaxID=2487749 RepID=A0AAW4PCE0_9EURY|nr:pyridoxamine 5'-phosphate oxidase family protein [Halomicroarcula nitratireducens]MBX0295576.1 pyridoxamine 5'-phosphate oxidase family protein [Halomicroarcula nitratireducens]